MRNDASRQGREKLRRVVILCFSFGRNLAYYRAGWGQHRVPLYPTKSAFWSQVNSNFLETCVLEWCKLFADKRGKHYWGNIVADPASFKAGLLRHLELDENAFEAEIKDMLKFRDKYIAHADTTSTIYVPKLDVAKKAAWFYYHHIADQEAGPCDLRGFLTDIDTGYEQCEEEARAVYQRSGSVRVTGRGS
jgi:hypothetical protein